MGAKSNFDSCFENFLKSKSFSVTQGTSFLAKMSPNESKMADS